MGEQREAILKAENVWKLYDKKPVLKGINLEIKSGEIFGIIGSSGSGKSTLLNAIIGFLPPTKGRISFKNPHLLSYSEDGEDVNTYQGVLENLKEAKKLYGFAAQRPSTYPKLTLIENLDLFGSLYDLSTDARQTNAKILLKLMGLFENRNERAENLSGGMMKRLDIACALIHDPKILILDEPTADLDPYLRKQMWSLIRKINSKGTTIILSSHFLDELEELCDRVGIIHEGKMNHCGSPDQLHKQFKTGEAVHFRTPSQKYESITKSLLKSKVKFKINNMARVNQEFVIHSHKPTEIIKFLVAWAKKNKENILDLRMTRPTLDEVFEHIIEVSEHKELKERAERKKNCNAIILPWYKRFRKNKQPKEHPACTVDELDKMDTSKANSTKTPKKETKARVSKKTTVKKEVKKGIFKKIFSRKKEAKKEVKPIKSKKASVSPKSKVKPEVKKPSLLHRLFKKKEKTAPKKKVAKPKKKAVTKKATTKVAKKPVKKAKKTVKKKSEKGSWWFKK